MRVESLEFRVERRDKGRGGEPRRNDELTTLESNKAERDLLVFELLIPTFVTINGAVPLLWILRLNRAMVHISASI